WNTGKHFTGPAELTRKFSIRETPVYVRAGAIVPMAPEMHYTTEKPVDPLIVNVFPLSDGQKSSYTLYEDSSTAREYQNGKAAWIDLQASESNGDLQLRIAPVRGSYAGMPTRRGYELRLPGDWPPASVTVNGKTLNYAPIENSIGWRYDGNILTTVVTLPRAPVTSSVTIQIRRTPELVARRNELDGFAGAMTRLRESYDTLNQTWPLGWSPDQLIDAMQSGDRLTYHPESASKEIAHYREVLPQAQGQVQALTKGFSQEQMEKIATRVGQDWKSDAAKKKITEYNDRVGRALAQIGDINNGAQSQAAARGAQ